MKPTSDDDWVVEFSTEFLKQAEEAYDRDFYDWMGHSCEYNYSLVEWLIANIHKVPEDKRTWCIFTLGSNAERHYWDRRKEDQRDPDLWLPAGYHGSAHTCIIEGRDPSECKICKKQEANNVPKPGKQIARRRPKVGTRVRILPFQFKLKAYWNGWHPRREDYIGRIGTVVSGYPPVEGYEPVSIEEDFYIPGGKWCSYEDWFTRSAGLKEIPVIDITLDDTGPNVFVQFERRDNRFVPDDHDRVFWDNLPHVYSLDEIEVIHEEGRPCQAH